MKSLLQTCRLVAMTVLGAFFFYVVGGIYAAEIRDGYGIERAIQYRWAIVGVACGAGAELAWRGWKPSWRISLWGALEATALIALAIAVVTLIGRA